MTNKEPRFFSREELSFLKKGVLPQHVAIIMDGNRRWAKKHSVLQVKNVIEGHNAGAEILENIVGSAIEIGIKVLTVWGFSTENWKRPRVEIERLIYLFELYLNKKQNHMVERNVRFNVIGNIAPFPSSLKEAISKVIEMTKEGGPEKGGIDLVLALNYGGRDDIKRAIEKMLLDVERGKLEKKAISEETISHYLDTASWKDPDLLIRTSNEMRVSNFLLWQLAYTEMYVTEKLWPDFTPQDLWQAVKHFQERERRIGQ